MPRHWADRLRTFVFAYGTTQTYELDAIHQPAYIPLASVTDPTNEETKDMKSPMTMTKYNIAALGLLASTACAGTASQGMATQGKASSIYSDECITEQEVVEAQKAWGDGIVKIGEAYSSGGDYRRAASDHINKFYAYDLSLVLFKPTLASVDQFRASFDGALSYFIGGNPTHTEDKGFALKPWTKVRWANTGIINNGCNMAVAMGNYYFTPTKGDEVKVEYSIGYVKDQQGDLRMVLHQSSLPYQGQ